jgi:hypothetical protein
MLEMFERLLASLIILALLILVAFIALPPGDPQWEQIKHAGHPKIPCPPGHCPDTPSISVPPEVTEPTMLEKVISLFHPYSERQLNIDGMIDKLIYYWAGVMALYLIGSYPKKKFLSIPSWTELKGISEHQLFKLSYFALFAIPIWIYLMHINIWKWEFSLHVPTNAKLSYFSAFSFAVGGIIYGITSPKNVGSEPGLDESRLFWRWLCYLSLMYGVLFLLIAFYRTSLFVFFAK